jgi:hypothetical protein
LTHFDVLHIYYVSEEGERAATYELFHSHRERHTHGERETSPSYWLRRLACRLVRGGEEKESHLEEEDEKKKGGFMVLDYV